MAFILRWCLLMYPSFAFRSIVTRARSIHTAATQYTIDCSPTNRHTLQQKISKHLDFRLFLESKPIAAHTQAAFDELSQKVQLENIILDSGCGTGRSSLYLGEQNPQFTVVGVDRSSHRLGKNAQFSGSEEEATTQVADNVWLVRAELVDFWRCLRQENINIHQHYMLYPNPYPKASRLASRWYGHPGFPLLLLTAGDKLILRSNWKTYLEEFAYAVEYADEMLSDNGRNYARPYVDSARQGPTEYKPDPDQPWTNFEAKYIAAGESLYQLNLEHHRSNE